MDILRLSTLSLALAVAVFALGYANPAFAGKDKNCDPDEGDVHPSCKDDGGGDPPPCEDTFPGFLYEVDSTRKLPAELRLASSNGCRTELVSTSANLRGSTFHMTADRSEGVIVWTEDPDNNNQSIVWRRDFTVNESGALTFDGVAVTILPLVKDDVLDGHAVSYGNLDIWGDANHDLLFLVTNRRTSSIDPNTGIKKVLIYDLNTLPNVNAGPGVREIYYEDIETWGGNPEWQDAIEPPEDCNVSDIDPETGERIFFPRFIASCYRPEPFRFNSSGTRIYFSSKLFLFDGRREFAEMRLNIDWNGSSYPGDWDITGPEIVYVNGPRDALPRPGNSPLQLPSPEIVMAQWDDQFLNADTCAEEYAKSSGPNKEPLTTIWLDCLVFDLFTNSDTSFRAWDSSDSYLFYRSGIKRRDDDDIYRFYVSGKDAGMEEKLIENGNSPSSGF